MYELFCHNVFYTHKLDNASDYLFMCRSLFFNIATFRTRENIAVVFPHKLLFPLPHEGVFLLSIGCSRPLLAGISQEKS